MNVRRARLIFPVGISLLSLTCAGMATSRIEARSATHAVRDSPHRAASDGAGLVATLDPAFNTLNPGKFAKAIQQFADAESEGHSRIATGRIGPCQGYRTTSRILVNGVVSARACIRQLGSADRPRLP